MKYLFLIHIGPVQDFIASARRTRDLAFGSWFLSELSRAAAREIEAQNGLDSLIFPAPASAEMLKGNNKEFLVANKIIAWVQQPPQELGARVRQAVMDELHIIREHAYKEIRFAKNKWQFDTEGKRQLVEKGYWQLTAEAQVDNLVEFFWVALPFNGEDYPQTRRRLEKLMAARKNTRDFAQATGDAVPKSSISGQLESVIPESDYPQFRASEEDKREKLRTLYKNYGAGPAERLSGVDLLKRRGITVYGEHFQSTSHMATLPFLERLKTLTSQPQLENVRKAWQVYIQEVQQLAFSPQLEQIPRDAPPHPVLDRSDGSMLLEGRLVDVIYAPGEDKTRSARMQKAKLALENFYKKIDIQCTTLGLSKARPDTYYAFLQADGDGMGELINAQAEQGYLQHREFSRKLSDFSTLARETVERHRGALVYAGGDDVVALLPLDTVLECASELAEKFRATLQVYAFKDSNGQMQTPSLSAGIAIAHHLDSLHQVRHLAKQAEDHAKSLPGKNALSLTLSKRSGEDYSITGHWKDLDISLQRLIDFSRRGAVPNGTAYELRDLLLHLDIPTDQTHTTTQKQASDPYAEVIKWDALRILKRKLSVPKGKFPQNQVQEIERFFKARLDIEPALHSDGERIQPVALSELINELIIAQILAHAKELATQEKEKSYV